MSSDSWRKIGGYAYRVFINQAECLREHLLKQPAEMKKGDCFQLLTLLNARFE